MLELVAFTAVIYFVSRSWHVYKSAGRKAKAAYDKTKPKSQPQHQGLSPDELAKLRSLLGNLK